MELSPHVKYKSRCNFICYQQVCPQIFLPTVLQPSPSIELVRASQSRGFFLLARQRSGILQLQNIGRLRAIVTMVHLRTIVSQVIGGRDNLSVKVVIFQQLFSSSFSVIECNEAFLALIPSAASRETLVSIRFRFYYLYFVLFQILNTHIQRHCVSGSLSLITQTIFS